MSLQEKMQSDLRQSMLQREELRRDTLRMVLSAIHNRQIELKRPLSDDETLEIISRQLKQRRESIVAFLAGGREEKARQEEAESVILQAYLPEQIGADEVERAVQDVIVKTKASGSGDLGKVMSQVMPMLKGRADGKLISDTVRRLLT